MHLVSEYKNNWGPLKNDSPFSVEGLDQMSHIYSGTLDQLTIAYSALTTQMSDGRSVQLIESSGKVIKKNLADLTGVFVSHLRDAGY